MIWLYEDDDEKIALENILKESDRAVGIVGASIVEVRLTKAIKQHLKIEGIAEKKLEFSLGSFANKIEVAYALGIVDLEAQNDLQIIRDVRNKFAHELKFRDFNNSSVKEKVMMLSMVKSYVGHAEDKEDSPLLNMEKDTKPWMFTTDYAKKIKKPRDRFLLSAAIFSLYFRDMTLASIAKMEHGTSRHHHLMLIN